MINIDLAFIISSFIAGILTFLAPCTFPLIPAYIGFITGEGSIGKNKNYKKDILYNGIFFVLGFTLIFVLFGLFAISLAKLIGPNYRQILSRIGAVIIIFFGLNLLGVFKLKFLQQTINLKFPRYMTPGSKRSSFLLGVSLAFGWSPCIGPILGSILTLTFNVSTVYSGVLMMLVFSIGLAVPFILTAIFIGEFTGFIKKIESATVWISKLSGLILIFIGVLLMTNYFGYFSNKIFKWFDFFNYDSLLDLL